MTETSANWDKSFFLKLLIRSLFLNICWPFVGTQIGRLFHKDLAGFIMGFGFLLIYSITFFLSFEKKKRSGYNFLILTLILFVIFLAATFVVPIFFINGETDLSVYLFLFCSTLVAIISIVSIIGIYTVLKREWLTIGITTIITFTATSIYLSIIAPDHFDSSGVNNIANPLAIGFCSWQILTTAIIGQAMSYK